jgi:microcystin-dependent protein
MDPFVAEIRIVGFNFAPQGWASCDGQLLPLSQNTALFSLLGTQYGGDGKSTFGLPNFQGSVPIHTDQYSGAGQYPIGATGGEQTVTLLQSEMPSHPHTMQGRPVVANVYTAASNTSIAKPDPATNLAYQTAASSLTNLNAQAVTVAGGSNPHNNMQPYLTLFFIIAMQGVFPPRT